MTQDFASDDRAEHPTVRSAAAAFAAERRQLLHDQRAHRRDALVDQAVGVVMARSACGSAEAVAQLAAIAERTRRPLADVAADVVAEASGRSVEPAERSDTLRLRPEIAGLDRAADGDDLARVLIAEALGFSHPGAAAIGLLDDEGTVAVVGSHGFPARGIRRWRRIPPAVDCLMNRALRAGRPVWTDATTPDPPPPLGEPAGADRARTRVAVPVRFGRALIGVVELAWPASAELDERARRHAEAVVRSVGPSLLRTLGTDTPAGPARHAGSGGSGGAAAPAGSGGAAAQAESGGAAGPASSGGSAGPAGSAGSGGAAGPAGSGASALVPAGAAAEDSAWQDLLDLMDQPALALAEDTVAPGALGRFRVIGANGPAGELMSPAPTDGTLADAVPWLLAADLPERLAAVLNTGAPHRLRVQTGPLGVDALTAVRVGVGTLVVVCERASLDPTAADGTLERLARFGTWRWDVDGDRVAWSAEALRIVDAPGLGDSAGIDRPPYTVHPDDTEAERRFVKTLTVERRPAEAEFRILHYGGEPTRVRVTAEPVGDDGGEHAVAGVVGVVQDVTELRRAETGLEVARVQLAAQRSRADAERQLASALQLAVIPSAARNQPPRSGVQIAARYRPASASAGVGGDWYSVFPLRDDKLLLAIGDVAGHGLPAASAMADLHHGLRGMALAETRPGRLLTLLNELVETMPQFTIASACALLWDPATRRLTWGNAGHPAPLRIRGGVPEPMYDAVGPMLGADPRAVYEDCEADVASGDVLLLYTDGLVERRQVGDDETIAHLLQQTRYPDADLDRYADRVLDGARSDTDDDVCVLAVRFE
ncbi:PAS domain S-box-containing protein [Catenulispora sp. MAP5-51]|uniref:SpoIIE family protein phosphatase n=1 Tax=Catenulispora sp. MAP5-51 TaxID=3156298 RepID=UPI0035154483